MVRRLPNPPRPPGAPYDEGPTPLASHSWNSSSPQAALGTSPWRRSYIIEWLSRGRLRRGCVVSIVPTYSEATGDWVPRLMVQPVTDSGKWSATWVMVWPGEILEALKLKGAA